MRAAERGIWKSAEMRRRLAAEGLEISAGKMSSWWAGTPPTIRLDELDVICVVLDCTPSDLMVPEPERVAARRPPPAEGRDDQRPERRPAQDHAAVRQTPLRASAVSPAAGKDAALRVPPLCNKCQSKRVAWSKPRVDFCYDCLPGGPFTPPPCSRCATTTDYFSQGLCQRCHPRSPERVGSCKDCLAWGVFPQHNFLCWTCRWWRQHYPRGVCDYCGRDTTVGDQGACRLCLEQARMLQEPGRALDLAGANKHGQQLFFANMIFQRPKTRRLKPANGWKTPGGWGRPGPPPKKVILTEWVQPVLIDVPPDPEMLRQKALIENSELTRYCAVIVNEHAETFGWSVRQRNDVIRSLRLLQTLRDSPTAKIRATDVLQLPRYDGNIVSTIDVLAAADLLIEDRPRPIEVYFTKKAAGLPPIMREQLEVWMRILLDGATTAPGNDPATR